jgi:hypothetical protein
MAREVILFTSANRVATSSSEKVVQVGNEDYRGVWLYLDVTANLGTSETLDVTLERQDPVGGGWLAIPGAVFTQKTGVTADQLTVYPTMTAAANDVVKEHIGGAWRAVATFGGTDPEFTFSLGGYLLR